MRRNSRRFHRRSAAAVVGHASAPATSARYGLDACARARGRRDRRAGRAATASATTADGERARRARERDEPVAHAVGSLDQSSAASSGCGVERAARPRVRAAAASADRSMALGEVGRLGQRVRPPPGHRRQCRRILYRCLGSGSPPRSSTSSSATSKATSTRILDAYERADAAGCDLVAFPELVAHGLPARGPAAAAGVRRPGARVAREGRGAHRRVPPRSSASPRPSATSPTRPPCCAHGAVQGVYRKHLLPNYAVFDEQRYFAPSTVDGPLFVVGGVRVGGHDLRGRVEPDRARSSRRPRAAPSSSSTSTRRRTTRAASTSARRCSRRARPTRRCRSST